MTTRRSFLALLAASLSVKPEELTKSLLRKGDVLPVTFTGSANPIIEGWWRQWTVMDAVTIQPNQETFESLFASPIPSDFVIHSMGWGAEDSILLADFRQILDRFECQLTCDGRAIAAGKLHWFGGQGFTPSPFKFHTAIAPRGDFKLDVAGAPLGLSKPNTIHFWLSGQIAYYCIGEDAEQMRGLESA